MALSISQATGLSFGQTAVNANWIERDGLTVASSQTVSTPPTRIRLFTTLSANEKDPIVAIEKIVAEKKLVAETLQQVGVDMESVRFTTPRILEWQRLSSYTFGDNRIPAIWPLLKSTNNTAVLHVTFCKAIKQDVAADLLAIETLKLCRDLNRYPVFSDRPILVLFSGQVSRDQIRDAQTRAFEEAQQNAEQQAAISKIKLDRVAALTTTDFPAGAWGYSQSRRYSDFRPESETASPLYEFEVEENELFGPDPTKLTRTINIEIRYLIGK